MTDGLSLQVDTSGMTDAVESAQKSFASLTAAYEKFSQIQKEQTEAEQKAAKEVAEQNFKYSMAYSQIEEGFGSLSETEDPLSSSGFNKIINSFVFDTDATEDSKTVSFITEEATDFLKMVILSKIQPEPGQSLDENTSFGDLSQEQQAMFVRILSEMIVTNDADQNQILSVEEFEGYVQSLGFTDTVIETVDIDETDGADESGSEEDGETESNNGGDDGGDGDIGTINV